MSAWERRGILRLSWPVQYGSIVNWDDYEKLVNTLCYDSLRIAPEEHVFVSVLQPHLFNSRESLERLVQIMFETYNVPAFLPVPSNVAALYALSMKRHCDCMTGVVVSIGATVVVSCVENGVSIKSSIVVRKLGGVEISERLKSMLVSSGFEGNHEFVEEIKAKLCFVAPYPLAEFAQDYKSRPDLVDRTIPRIKANDPDGVGVVGKHLFEPAEILFAGEESLPRMVIQSLSKCPRSIRKRMTSILLEGKTTLLPGFASRLEAELELMGVQMAIEALPQRGHLAWIGASIWIRRLLASMTESSHDGIITTHEYDEVGPSEILLQKSKLVEVPRPFNWMGHTIPCQSDQSEGIEDFDDRLFLQEVDAAMAGIRSLLTSSDTAGLLHNTSHSFQDQFETVENLVDAARGSVTNCLEFLGISRDADPSWKLLMQWGKTQNVMLRFEGEEQCVFLREESHQVASLEHAVNGVVGDSRTKFSSKVETTIKENVWLSSIDYKVTVSQGFRTDTALAVTRLKRESEDKTSSTSYAPGPRGRARDALEVDVSWLANMVSQQFLIDRTKAKTPRRNEEVSAALDFFTRLQEFVLRIIQFASTKCSHSLDGKNGNSFVPVIPILFKGRSSSILQSKEHVSRLLEEHKRSLSSHLDCVCKEAPAQADEVRFLSLLKNIVEICERLKACLCYCEKVLRDDIMSVIGMTISPQEFSAFVKHRFRKILLPEFAPRPLAYFVRRSSMHDSDGFFSLDASYRKANGEEYPSEPIQTFTQIQHNAARMTFGIGATTTVNFKGDRYLHGWLAPKFGAEKFNLRLRARARCYGDFVLLVGIVAGPSTFEPKRAIIVSNQDDLDMPLDLEVIPSPKEFADAIASLSPEQQRFAKAFRDMQLAASVFGVCIIQIKPQLERVLRLPRNALTKELELTQDLMSLLTEYQLPSDLLAFSGDSNAPIYEKVNYVRTHVKDMKMMCKALNSCTSLNLDKYASAIAGLSRERAGLRAGSRESFPGLRCDTYDDDGDDDVELQAVVLDIGSNLSKAGFGGEATLREETMSVVGRPKYMGIMVGMNQKDSYSGGPPPVSNLLGAPAESTQVADHNSSSANASTDEAPAHTRLHHGMESSERDYSEVPSIMEKCYGALDTEGAVRPCIIHPSSKWVRARQGKRQTLYTEEQTSERNRAYDLLDALTLSGNLSIEDDAAEVHIVIASQHGFCRSMMDTLLIDNVNPIENIERSGIIMASAVHQQHPKQLLSPCAAELCSHMFLDRLAALSAP